MGRIINPEGSGKERTKLIRAVVIALRELLQTEGKGKSFKDLAAFIAMSLGDIYQTVDSSVTAWEKKGYWVKADRFRMEWEWSNIHSQKMIQAIDKEDWETFQDSAIQVAMKLGDVHIPTRHRLGTPWVGAWQTLNTKK